MSIFKNSLLAASIAMFFSSLFCRKINIESNTKFLIEDGSSIKKEKNNQNVIENREKNVTTIAEPVQNTKELEKEFERYWDERKNLIEGHRQISHLFDKSLLSLSGGAFAVSIAFINNIGIVDRFYPILAIAWALFILSILFTMFSIKNSEKAFIRQQDIVLECFVKRNCNAGGENEFNKKVEKQNAWSLWLFVGGIFALAVFALLSLTFHKIESRGYNNMSQRISKQSGMITENTQSCTNQNQGTQINEGVVTQKSSPLSGNQANSSQQTFARDFSGTSTKGEVTPKSPPLSPTQALQNYNKPQ